MGCRAGLKWDWGGEDGGCLFRGGGAFIGVVFEGVDVDLPSDLTIQMLPRNRIENSPQRLKPQVTLPDLRHD